jgi:hypothetical protein
MKIAICLIIKDENEYLQEWIDYHRSIGIDHFFIYDNESKEPVKDNSKDVTVKLWTDNIHASQCRAYKDCCINNSNYNYIAFIDTDEFIMLNGYSNIKDCLKSISMSFDALVLSWRMYGQPKPYFTNKTPMTDYIYYHEDIHVKSLVNPKKVIEFKNPHNSTITGICIDELGNKVKGAWNIHTSKNIWIKHIWTRSQSEFKIKIERGTGDKVVRERTMQDFINHNDKCILND